MSLFGTGRREGVVAALMIGALTAAAHVGSALQYGTPAGAVVFAAIACAVGGMACYRWLRVLGRSRYASFLGGLAYGLTPWLAGLSCAPRELLAAAAAPFALEVVGQCSRPSSRRRWLWIAGPCVALPFLFGATTVAYMTAGLSLFVLLHAAFCGDNSDERAPALRVFGTIATGALFAANLAWLDLFAPLLGVPFAPTAWQVLSADVTYPSVWNATTLLRVTSPFLLWFALLGLLRRQRHANATRWLLLAALGAAPMLLSALAPAWIAATPALPATGWFLVTLAVVVLGAAGLDDFLDHPTRRRFAQRALLVATLATTPLLPLLEATPDRTRQLILLSSLVALALTSLSLRRLGILRFKNVLTTLAVAAVVAPLLQHQLLPPSTALAAPLVEGSLADAALAHLRARPLWHYAGLFAAALGCGLLLVTRAKR